MARPRSYTTLSYSENHIEQSILSMGMDSWICSMVETEISEVGFTHEDFMGNEMSIISVDDIVRSFLFYAFRVGRGGDDTQWEDECYTDFIRREKSFNKMLKKVDNYSTKAGTKKISSVKKMIRRRVEDRERLHKEEMDTLGVFLGNPEMKDILDTKSPREMVRKLQLLGNEAEGDPRYYLHTIFRYHMNELHQILCDKKVMRFPSMQKILDIVSPVSSYMNLPPEFRGFMSTMGGSSRPVVSLPLPSKAKGGSVVYGYSFEDIQWVQVMRQEIYKIFSEWKSGSSVAYLDIYPKTLLKDDPGNKTIVEVMAKSMDMENLKHNFDSMKTKGLDTKMFEEIIPLAPDVVNLYERYRKCVFSTPGEQLRERRGFFMHSSTRETFQSISKQVSKNIHKDLPRNPTKFCNDVYYTLGIDNVTIDEFYDYCSNRNPRKFSEDDHELWRTFLAILEKICLVFHVVSREKEMEDFYSEYGTSDAYIAKKVNSGIV